MGFIKCFVIATVKKKRTSRRNAATISRTIHRDKTTRQACPQQTGWKIKRPKRSRVLNTRFSHRGEIWKGLDAKRRTFDQRRVHASDSHGRTCKWKRWSLWILYSHRSEEAAGKKRERERERGRESERETPGGKTLGGFQATPGL